MIPCVLVIDVPDGSLLRTVCAKCRAEVNILPLSPGKSVLVDALEPWAIPDWAKYVWVRVHACRGRKSAERANLDGRRAGEEVR